MERLFQYLFLNPEWLGWTDSEELSQVMDEILYAGSQEEAQKLTDELHQVFWNYLPILKPVNSTNITSIRNNVEGYDYVQLRFYGV